MHLKNKLLQIQKDIRAKYAKEKTTRGRLNSIFFDLLTLN